MKRIFVLLISCSILFSFNTVNASTPENSQENFYADEIQDTELLRNRAKNGITDFIFDEDTELQVSIKELTNEQKVLSLSKEENNSKIVLKDTLYTVQKLKSVQKNGVIVSTDYVVHIFVDVSIEDDRIFTRGIGSGSESDDDGDSVTGATLEMVAYYTYNKDGMDDPYFCFTNVKAKYIRYDSAITASNLKINNNKMGLIYYDMYGNNFYGYTDYDMITIASPASGTWYNNYNSRYVLLTGTGGSDGVATASSQVKLQRGSRTWYLECLVVKEYI